jgi:hypothetical protein
LLFLKNFDIIYLSKDKREEDDKMNKNWTYEDQMIFESDLKDSILTGVAYFNSTPSYDVLEEEDFDDFCDPFFEVF